MNNPPTNPDEKLSSEQRAAMIGELDDLRLRAEHGLLRRLVVMTNGGSCAGVSELTTALRDLTAARG